jgi:hypothetical protein
MGQVERNVAKVGCRFFLFVLAFAFVAPTHAGAAVDECLLEFAGVPDANANGGPLICTDCDPTCDSDGVTTANGSCTFALKLCTNPSSAACTGAGTALKIVKVKGKCQGASGLKVTPTGTTEICQSSSVVVTTKKKGRKPGKCTITASTSSSAKPRKTDKDVLKLTCMPRPAGEACPTTTTTTTSTTTLMGVTTTTSVCGSNPTPCAPIVIGTPIAAGQTYVLNGTAGDKICTTNAASNRFGACTTDADCGATAGSCLQLPWVTADGQIMPFPTAVQTKFTVNTVGNFPCCEHAVCVPCGNANATCNGIPGCNLAGNPNACIPRATQGCCDQPGFIVPTFFVNILGGLCSRVDQISCGVGVVNTSNPQTGDNEVTKVGDTSDPGPDCQYGTPDDPAPTACTVAGTGQGNDYKGKIVSTVGDGHADADGIHYRLTTPELSTTWSDSQSPVGDCANGSTFDDGELLVSQLVLQAQPTTAGASGSFADMNGDGCKRAGAGFISSTNAATDGPITVGPAPGGPVHPQSYDGTVGAVSAAVSVVFSGPNSPIRDIGFVAINPQQPIVATTPTACTCNPTAGCPE